MILIIGTGKKCVIGASLLTTITRFVWKIQKSANTIIPYVRQFSVCEKYVCINGYYNQDRHQESLGISIGGGYSRKTF